MTWTPGFIARERESNARARNSKVRTSASRLIVLSSVADTTQPIARSPQRFLSELLEVLELRH